MPVFGGNKCVPSVSALELVGCEMRCHISITLSEPGAAARRLSGGWIFQMRLCGITSQPGLYAADEAGEAGGNCDLCT